MIVFKRWDGKDERAIPPGHWMLIEGQGETKSAGVCWMHDGKVGFLFAHVIGVDGSVTPKVRHGGVLDFIQLEGWSP